MCVPLRIHICDVTYSYVWRDVVICVTWRIHVWRDIKVIWNQCCSIDLVSSKNETWQNSFSCVTWLTQMCDMTPSNVWRDSSLYITWRIHSCAITHSYLWRVTWPTGWQKPIGCLISCITFRRLGTDHRALLRKLTYKYKAYYDSTPPRILYGMASIFFLCVTWRIHTCNVTQLCVWPVSSICAPWLSQVCDMTYPYVRHHLFSCATWRIHVCDMTTAYLRHDSFVCATRLIHIRPRCKKLHTGRPRTCRFTTF